MNNLSNNSPSRHVMPPDSIDENQWDQEKDRLADAVTNIVRDWMKESRHFLPKDLNTLPEGCYPCEIQVENVGSVNVYFSKDELLSNVPEDVDEMVEGLEGTAKAAYEFFLNKVVNAYNINSKKLGGYGPIIMEFENIKDLKNSGVLKVAALTLLDGISEGMVAIQNDDDVLGENKEDLWR